MKKLISLLLLAVMPAALRAYDPIGSVYVTDGSSSDVASALAAVPANAGYHVSVPAGTFTWGAGGQSYTVKAGVTFRGEGINSTFILISSSAPSGNSNGGLIRHNSNSIIYGFNFDDSANNAATHPLFSPSTTGASAFRIYGNLAKLEAGAFWYANGGTTTDVGVVYEGSIDGNDITGDAGNNELIYWRGRGDAWNYTSPRGTNNLVFIDNNDFRGTGYVCDANANAAGAVRYNRIWGNIKIDGHGFQTSTPKTSYRMLEIIGNQFYGSGTGMELRGGSNYILNNQVMNAASSAFSLWITEYCAFQVDFGGYAPGVYADPTYAPLSYQAGTGPRQTYPASSVGPKRLVRIASLGTGPATDFMLHGAPNNTIGTQFLTTSTPTGNGTVTYTPSGYENGGEPNYAINNTGQTGAADPWARTSKNVYPQAAFDQYAANGGPGGGVYNDFSIIVPEVHVFGTAGFQTTFPAGSTFTGANGVGRGTKASMPSQAAMLALPARVGVGYWVTDEAEWNSTIPGNDGQLYVWNGSNWVLHWTPAPYPNVYTLAPPPAGTPNTPTGLTASSNGIFQCSLSWTDASSDETAFEVQQSAVGADVGFVTIATLPAGTTTYTATGIPEASTRYFRVRAYNGTAGLNSSWSAEANATTLTMGHVPMNRLPSGPARGVRIH